MAALPTKPQTIGLRLNPTPEDRKILKAINRQKKRHGFRSAAQVIRTAIMQMDERGGE